MINDVSQILDVSKIREGFPILQEKIQLSSCSQSALHVDVKASINRYVQSWEEQGMNWEGWMKACENARLEFAKMINADVSEVAIVSSVSHAVSTVATSFINQKKNKVFVTDFDFPTVGHIWLSHRDHYNVQFINKNESNFTNLEDYEQVVDEETLLVSTSHVSFYDGYKQDLKKVANIVHERGSYLFVDAYQSLGQCEIDVKATDIDMLAAGLQKYALGIPGIAFLYVKKEIAETLTPKITGWFGQSNPFAFDIKNVDYAEHAKRFDSGTFPMINGFAAEAALKILNQWDSKGIEQYLQELSRLTISVAEERGLTVKSPKDVTKKGSNTAIYVVNAPEVEGKLRGEGIIVSARNDVIRIAPHFYNTEEDIRKAIAALAKYM
ncbi:aminotransferase class V-fold PLP-dependent enzyme [Aquibacillus sp. 3ASR75-11]|uniref:Aminotransferase class V-fold PLP-dependent enzyme n=1 Tax=Terrihalobacillus insolitus TaxID=2950438 RepID=A0A9X3WPH7_9BACI|nr:aminotransferase class V-fold PLP-dependent enzyme [Terrihalobacillus insolitus]MDC3411881.1 aminotransferase class V-fold PLP-dependent enzyme [Terrihalobacillus insolitus]MDC3423440.1 aminotransferase class V-fold PLP-dependent enzyme [Terrihalobacillus insolitus]